jgi:flavin-dependent dehydrogenase
LLPFCHGIFRELGVLESMERNYVRKPGVRFITGDGSQASTWCFDRVIDDSSSLSFQVARGEFDKMLLENARRLGATVCEETRVTELELEHAEGGVQVETLGKNGQSRTHTARFLLDASGRHTFLASKNRWRRANRQLDRTALWTHFSGVKMRDGLEEGLSLIVYLGGDKKGWSWVFPLGRDRITVGFVTDNAYIRKAKRDLVKEAGADWRLALFEREIRRSPVIEGIVAGAERCLDLMVNGDYSYSVDTNHGSNFALIGDASRFLDPIFSSGVFLSMKSARLVSDVVSAMLTDGATVAKSLDETYVMIDGAYNFVHRMINLFYNPHALNWAMATPIDASRDDAYARLHADAMAAGHYMLAGDFFEKQEKYNAIFKVLENPKDFAHYKSLVIDRERFQDLSCRREGGSDNFPAR